MKNFYSDNDETNTKHCLGFFVVGLFSSSSFVYFYLWIASFLISFIQQLCSSFWLCFISLADSLCKYEMAGVLIFKTLVMMPLSVCMLDRLSSYYDYCYYTCICIWNNGMFRSFLHPPSNCYCHVSFQYVKCVGTCYTFNILNAFDYNFFFIFFYRFRLNAYLCGAEVWEKMKEKFTIIIYLIRRYMLCIYALWHNVHDANRA